MTRLGSDQVDSTSPDTIELGEDQLDQVRGGVADPSNPNIVFIGGSRELAAAGNVPQAPAGRTQIANWEKTQELRSGR